MSAGKGDEIRPRQISDEEWNRRFEETFPKPPRRKRPSESAARRIGQLEMPLDDK